MIDFLKSLVKQGKIVKEKADNGRVSFRANAGAEEKAAKSTKAKPAGKKAVKSAA